MEGSHRIRRGIGKAARGLLLWLLIGLVFWAVAALLPSIDVPSFGAVLVTTALIAILHALMWPLLIRLLLPLTVLTFGLGLAGAERGDRLSGDQARGRVGTGVLRCAAPLVRPLDLPAGPRPGPRLRRRRPAAPPRPQARASSPQGESHRCPRRDHVRDRRPLGARAEAGPERGVRADDGAVAGGGLPPSRPVGVRPLLADRREPGGPAPGEQRRHAGLPLVREGERKDDGVQSRQGRRRARAAPLRRRRPARRRRREPREHVLRGRTPLLGDDERAARPPARQRAGVLRVFRRSLRVHAHDRTLTVGRAPRAAGRSPPAKARRRSTSTAAASTP